MLSQTTVSADTKKTSPVARAGHSGIRVPRTVAGLRGLTETDRTMTDTEFLVYLAMVDLADNKTHRLALNTTRIAARARVNVRSAQRVLKTGFLFEAGLIEHTDVAYAVTVVAPTERNGGYLSIPRAALWESADAAIAMPAAAVQSLLVLIAHSTWSQDGTTVTASRHRETMATDLISLDRFKRGLRTLDGLPWVLLAKQQYDATLASFGMARRMPTVRVIDWSLVPAYVRAEKAQEALSQEIPAVPVQQREETAPVAPPAPQQLAARPAQTAPVVVQPVDTSLLTWIAEGKGVRLADITSNAQAVKTLVSDTKVRLAQGWTLEDLQRYCLVALARTKQVSSVVGWLRSTGLPGGNVPVGEVPVMSKEEATRAGARTAQARTWEMKKSMMAEAAANTVYADDSPY